MRFFGDSTDKLTIGGFISAVAVSGALGLFIEAAFAPLAETDPFFYWMVYWGLISLWYIPMRLAWLNLEPKKHFNMRRNEK